MSAGFSELARSAGRNLVRLSWAGLLGAGVLAVSGAAPAVAMEGGGGGGGGTPECPWARDLEVTLGTKKLELPASIFKSREMEHQINGYAVTVDKTSFYVTIVSPEGVTYQAGLTLLETKRCIAYYIGKPVFIRRAE